LLAAGGWEGMKRLAETCADLGYLFSLHDQYRDYYVDAPSYDPQFAIHEEDAVGAREPSQAELAQIRRMSALHKRVALLEMTRHEFLDENCRKKRTTFSDGTTVTVDWDARTVQINPELD
jgi:hypothetical protein